MGLLEDISKAVEELEKEEALSLVQKALDEGIYPPDIINSGIVPGLQGVGKRFEAEEYFLAELMMGGKVSQSCIDLVQPHLPDTGGANLGTVILGAVEGDLHDIGYGLVATQLELNGFKVHKIGVNIPAMTFIDKAKELNADIIGLSAFLVTTIPNCNEVINYLQDMGIKDKYKVIIGGAETSQEKADEMGADGWAPNAVEAVTLCKKLIGV
ncbi:MAG: cobalamin-dependent protein [Dehalococcoidia bacterium]